MNKFALNGLLEIGNSLILKTSVRCPLLPLLLCLSFETWKSNIDGGMGFPVRCYPCEPFGLTLQASPWLVLVIHALFPPTFNGLSGLVGFPTTESPQQ